MSGDNFAYYLVSIHDKSRQRQEQRTAPMMEKFLLKVSGLPKRETHGFHKLKVFSWTTCPPCFLAGCPTPSDTEIR